MVRTKTHVQAIQDQTSNKQSPIEDEVNSITLEFYLLEGLKSVKKKTKDLAYI